MIKLNIKTLSVNRAWQGKRYKSKDYKEYEREVYYLLPALKIPKEGYLKFVALTGVSNDREDTDNFLKPFLDILQKRYEFNDSRIKRIEIEKTKVKKGEEFIEFSIEAML